MTTLDHVPDLSNSSDGTGTNASVRQALAVLETWPADFLVELVVQ